MDELPLGSHPKALHFPHFPSTFHAVIFRNWGQLIPSRIARALGSDEATVLREAERMGLDAPALADDEALWLRRGYLTLIRQNWHLLPYEQLLELLGWSPQRMAYTLKEDDFLWNKLGRLKPACERVTATQWDGDQEQAAAEIAKTVRPLLAELNRQLLREKPFDFLNTFQAGATGAKAQHARPPSEPRIVYSFSAVYGDPLLDASLDPYPDGLLEQYAACGINGIWLQGILYTLVPWLGPTPFSDGHETRMANLNRLIERAARFGIGVYLYLNEPRCMPDAFFDQHPHLRGKTMPTVHTSCLCVSHPEVLERLEQGARELAVKAPGLAGAFTITMSENPTHCHSKSGGTNCPRCAGSQPQELVVEVNNSIARGLFAGNPAIRMAAWDWSWFSDWSGDFPNEWEPGYIQKLDPRIVLLCTSEACLPTHSAGVDGLVGDYSISKPGPGPIALKRWSEAREGGREIWAKVQMNNSWECSGVPYLPVPFLVREHLDRVREEGVGGFLAAWTLGGYPGGNLRLLDQTPEDLAVEKFGPDLAPSILEAWRLFGEAFREFPLHGAGTLYNGPQNYGPMNLLFEKPTGWTATMVGFPYDDLKRWCSHGRYSEEIFEEQFRKMSDGWRAGLEILEKLAPEADTPSRAALDELLSVAKAAWCHFRTTYFQTRFIRLRDGSAGPGPDLVAVLSEEARVAEELLFLSVLDSRLGFEASNHYNYTRQNLLEKILNCQFLLRSMKVPPQH